MPELKTWKDIEKLCNTKGEKFVLHCLKAEAVKWFKIMKGGSPDRSLNNSEIWIKHFFNFTEEDLEEKTE